MVRFYVGHSNAIFIEGATSILLIDTLDSLERGKKLANIIRNHTEKKVKPFFTHMDIQITEVAQVLFQKVFRRLLHLSLRWRN